MHFVLREVKPYFSTYISVKKITRAMALSDFSELEIDIAKAIPIVGLVPTIELLCPREQQYEREIFKLALLFANEAQHLVDAKTLAHLRTLSAYCAGECSREEGLEAARMADQADATWGSPVAYLSSWVVMLRQREHPDYREDLMTRLTAVFMQAMDSLAMTPNGAAK